MGLFCCQTRLSVSAYWHLFFSLDFRGCCLHSNGGMLTQLYFGNGGEIIEIIVSQTTQNEIAPYLSFKISIACKTARRHSAYSLSQHLPVRVIEEFVHNKKVKMVEEKTLDFLLGLVELLVVIVVVTAVEVLLSAADADEFKVDLAEFTEEAVVLTVKNVESDVEADGV